MASNQASEMDHRWRRLPGGLSRISLLQYRKFPKTRTSNGTPASSGSAIGGGTDPYYDQQQQQPDNTASLLESLASLL